MLEGRKILGVIPARSGSVGCRGKNYREVNGRPLFIWSVEAALNSCIDTIAVATNDDTVAFLTEKHPAFGSERLLLVDRPEEISGPDSPSELVLIHTVESVEKIRGSFDIVVLLQPTSPIRRNGLIDETIAGMLSNDRSSSLTVSEHTPFFFKIADEDQHTICLFDPAKRPMRQSIVRCDMFYHDDGSVYCCTRDCLFSNQCRMDKNPWLIKNDCFGSIQVDTEDDMRLVDVLMRDISRTA